jgi:hypothetical protein
VGAISGEVLFASKFDSGDKSESSSWGNWNTTGNPQIVAVPGPFAGDDFTMRHRHTPGGPNTEQRFIHDAIEGYYFGFYGKWPSNYVHDGPNYNKFWRAWSGNLADGNAGYSQYHVKGGYSTMVTTPTTQSRIRPEFGYRRADGTLSGVGDFQYNPTGNVLGTSNTPLNTWVKVRGRIQLSSEKFLNDGILQLWFNDVLVFSATDVDLYSRDPAANHFFNRGYVLGAANSGYDVQTDIYTTRFRWATTYEKADPSLPTDW